MRVDSSSPSKPSDETAPIAVVLWQIVQQKISISMVSAHEALSDFSITLPCRVESHYLCGSSRLSVWFFSLDTGIASIDPCTKSILFITRQEVPTLSGNLMKISVGLLLIQSSPELETVLVWVPIGLGLMKFFFTVLSNLKMKYQL